MTARAEKVSAVAGRGTEVKELGAWEGERADVRRRGAGTDCTLGVRTELRDARTACT